MTFPEKHTCRVERQKLLYPVRKAVIDDATQVHELVQKTICTVYPIYYVPVIVEDSASSTA